MVLPLGILTEAQGRPVLVELKDGKTLNGHLVACDNWMNLILKEVVVTYPDGETFWRQPEIYVRGTNVKYFRLPDDVIEAAKQKQQQQQAERANQDRQSHRGGSGRGGYHHRGDGAGRGGRGGYNNSGGFRGSRGRGGMRGGRGGVPS